MRLDGGGEPQPIPGTEGGQTPSFSPDSRWIVYGAAGGLRRVSVEGGASIPVVTTEQAVAPRWAADSTIVYSTLDGVYRVPWTGGEPERILDEGALTARFAALLPGGRGVLYQRQDFGSDVSEIRVLDLSSGQSSTVLEDGVSPRLLPSGHILYARLDGAVLVVPFDLETLAVTGPSSPIFDSLVVEPLFGFASLSVSDGGTAVYLLGSSAGASARDRMALLDLDGTVDTLPLAAACSAFRPA